MNSAPTPDASRSSPTPGRSRRRHKKVFSGCWTCRAKHVKCDEAKPACMRCERSGAHCEGYGIRLSWTSSRDPSNFSASAATRRSLRRNREDNNDNGTREPPHHGIDASDQASPKFMTIVQDGEETPVGPSPPGTVPTGPAASTRSTQHESRPNPEVSQVGGSRGLSWPDWNRQTSAVSRNAPRISETYPASTRTAPAGQESAGTNTNPYEDISWLPTHHLSSPFSGTLHPHPAGSGGVTPICRKKQRHLDSLSDPADRSKLLEHWDLHVCDALNPIPGIFNPARTIFTPLALEGAREDVGTSTGAVALFHLICSASGFQLSKSEPAPDKRCKYENLALEHHNLGIAHLSRNIQSDDEGQYMAILASLIMCLLNEAITVYDPFWRLHIQGAVEWVNHVGIEYWHHTEEASTVYQMFMCMGILIQSQILPGDRSGYGWDLRYNPESQPGPYLDDSIFGIPQSILEVIHTMNRYQKRVQRSQQLVNHSTEEDEDEEYDLDALEFELMLMVPRRCCALTVSEEQSFVIYHIGYIYHYATLLYMKRTLKAVPLQDVQGFVGHALKHIEALQAIKYGPSSPSLWPIAIVAFEAHDPPLQKRVLACLDYFTCNSKLAVWEKFAMSVRGLWTRRRDEENANLSWHAYSPVFYHNYIFI